MVTSSTQLQNRSFHVAERTRTSAKWWKTARAKRAKLLFFTIKYANLRRSCCGRRGYVSSLVPKEYAKNTHVRGRAKIVIFVIAYANLCVFFFFCWCRRNPCQSSKLKFLNVFDTEVFILFFAGFVSIRSLRNDQGETRKFIWKLHFFSSSKHANFLISLKWDFLEVNPYVLYV